MNMDIGEDLFTYCVWVLFLVLFITKSQTKEIKGKEQEGVERARRVTVSPDLIDKVLSSHS